MLILAGHECILAIVFIVDSVVLLLLFGELVGKIYRLIDLLDLPRRFIQRLQIVFVVVQWSLSASPTATDVTE